MKNHLILGCLSTVLLGCSANSVNEKEYNQGINLLPVPQRIAEGEGKFTINPNTTISISNDSLLSVANFYLEKMKRSTGYALNKGNGYKTNTISLKIDNSVGKDINANTAHEAYHLSVSDNNIEVKASTKKGLFYGMATLMQLLPAEIESDKPVKEVTWAVPSVEIKDHPRFPYRGLMLDVARHFITVDGIKKHIDMLASVKINTLHLHLTDYQGWRVEIKKYPELTETGGKRIDEYGNEYSGFYSQDDIRELVKYAAERYITIIPEIDVPGHSIAAVAAYPDLSCTGEKYPVMNRWGGFPVVMCPGKETMFEMLDGIFAELSTLFPSEYFHIGGDECPKETWKKCPNCQSRIKTEKLFKDKKYSAEHKLQSYAISRCEKILKKYGKKMIGWDEILEGGLAPDATVMSWRGEKGGIASAKMGHNVIMTPTSGGMYLDYYQGNSQAEPFAWGGFAPIKRTYAYDPIPKELQNTDKEKHILGVQANAWTECMYTEDIVEYRVYPRILAVAETGWSPAEKKDFEDFSRRLNNSAVRMDYRKINYHIPLPEQPDFCRNHIAFTDITTVSFTTSRPMKMVYTIDGSEPNLESPIYSGPITIDKSAKIKIRSVLPSGKMSLTRTVDVEKQSYLKAENISPQNKGLKLRYALERHIYLKELDKIKNWKDSTLTSIEPIVKLRTNKYRNVEFFVAEAEGYVLIPKKSIYEFSSNNSRIYVGGRIAVDNDGKPQVNSTGGKSIALDKGWHKIKVQQISNSLGGWNSQHRNNGAVMMRKYGEKKWSKISADMLKYN